MKFHAQIASSLVFSSLLFACGETSSNPSGLDGHFESSTALRFTEKAGAQRATAEWEESRGVVISLTDRYRLTDYGEPINALKSYILSPFSDDQHVNAVLDSIWKARRELAGQS